MMTTPNITRNILFNIGQVVQHRLFGFRGVVVDVDPEFANTDEWWDKIPLELRPSKNQPFYHLLAENEDSSYEAYVSQQNLLPDNSSEPLEHPDIPEMFAGFEVGRYREILISRH